MRLRVKVRNGNPVLVLDGMELTEVNKFNLSDSVTNSCAHLTVELDVVLEEEEPKVVHNDSYAKGLEYGIKIWNGLVLEAYGGIGVRTDQGYITDATVEKLKSESERA